MDLHGSIFTGMAGGSGMERLSCIMHGPREREEQRIEKTTLPLVGQHNRQKNDFIFSVCMSKCVYVL